jgi:hypothetical protein
MVYVVAVFAALASSPASAAPAETTPAEARALHSTQAESTFPGTLFCEASGTIAAVRVPVSVSIDGTRANYSFPAPSESGGASSATETGTGVLGANRQFVLSGAASGRGLSYQAHYAGELSGRGGLLTGTQTGKAGGKSFTRRCQMTLGNGRG